MLHHRFQLLRSLEPLRVSAFAAFSPISGDPGLAVTFKHPRWRSRRFDAIFKERSADADLSNFLNLQSTDLGFYKPGVLSVALSTRPRLWFTSHPPRVPLQPKPSHDRPY